MIINNKERVDEYEPGRYRHGGRTGDRIKEEVNDTESNRIDIATAFFSSRRIVQYLENFITQGCQIRLIVRLNKEGGTDPECLRAFINKPGIMVRVFSATTFHPKFFVLKTDQTINTAFIGSANLTYNGMNNNDEVVVKVDDKDDLEHLNSIFTSYWDDKKATPLTGLVLDKFIESLGEEGWRRPNNGYGDGDQDDDDLIEYMQTFQDWNYKFNNVKEKYSLVLQQHNQRCKFPEIPLSIEIDAFFSFVYSQNHLRVPDNRGLVADSGVFERDVDAWINHKDEVNAGTIVTRYNTITNGFSSEVLQNDNLTTDELSTSIYIMHSPHRLNQANFFIQNELETVKENLYYLLHGDDEEVNQYKRMYDLIKGERQIKYLKESSIQELVGWFKFDSGFPIRNERSKRTMDFYMNVAENN